MQEPFSNMTHVVLENVQFSTSGQYSCEVSADAPSFHTALVSGDLNVVGKYKYSLSDNYF